MWLFGSAIFRQELINCFDITNGSSTFLTRVFTKYLDVTSSYLNSIDLKSLVSECSSQTSLDTEKRIRNYSDIVFQNQYCSKENMEFLEEISDFIVNLSISQEGGFSEEIIFRTVLYLEIIMVAVRHSRYDVEKLHNLVETSSTVVENVIINNSSSSDVNYRTAKVLEAFINKVMLCMIENADVLWKNIEKDKVMRRLMIIIQKSNMKRPLSLSVEVLKRFGLKMNESDTNQNYKIQFLDDALKSLYQSAVKSDLRIRRSPESRLVIHAMCSSDTNPNKPLLKWVLTNLIQVISDPNSAESAISSALHSIEILVSDNNLQCSTLPFISDIIVQCVELFARSSWIVRNADLQLTRAIIDRFYGVCLDTSNRPKCIEDLFILFPNLSLYFYKVLSCDKLDERAILVFQFFSESQIKEHFCQSDVSIERFCQLFMNILQRYPNHYGKMAARSYSAICSSKGIPEKICSILRFFKINFRYISKNVTANFTFLIQQLYEKYQNSFQHCISKEGIKVMNFAIKDLLTELRRYDTRFFDFVLFKVKPRTEILNEFVNCRNEDFRKRLWLHNNIPFLFISAKNKEITVILEKILSNDLLHCIQIKILTILISKLESNEFDNDIINEILKTLFKKSVSLSDEDNYLLNCYFKTILVFYRYNRSLSFKDDSVQFKITSNVSKLMIFVLYFSEQPEQLDDKQLFYDLVETRYMNLNSFSEELKNDIISTLPYLQKQVPKQLLLKIFKLIFYCSLFYSTHLETYRCITYITGKSYSSILSAFKDFFSVQNLSLHLKDRTLVASFFSDVIKYVPEHIQRIQSDGYYSEESDILIPKLFLERLINSEVKKI
ncbi:uncharacterized protein LOC108904191 [Anoplophora glabripennis]|uniref:uncharacterized protein LOC108904191 n=1 Tax=Anoplophora glabripennis TaxID=217634 RepID=UPI000C78DFD0|nr:uncharacterized protein LOC108904191 [Anoplophora glabripennis]